MTGRNFGNYKITNALMVGLVIIIKRDKFSSVFATTTTAMTLGFRFYFEIHFFHYCVFVRMKL